MKVQNLISYAAFVSVDKRTGVLRSREKLSGSCVFRQEQFQLPVVLNDDDGHSYDENESGLHENTSLHGHSQHRRTFFNLLSKSFLASTLLLVDAKPSNAACLSGDIRAECIGVYRLPIDAMESAYVTTPESLKMYAPDLKWVPPVEYPPTYADALTQLKEQRQQLDVAQDLIAKGAIEKAGLVMLDVIPKVNAAGLVIVTSYGKASNEERNAAMKNVVVDVDVIAVGNDGDDVNPSSTPLAGSLETKACRINDAMNELLGSLGEMDILIGQGLRGDLGVSAPAQIEILSTFPDCRRMFDLLFIAIPDTFSLS